MLADAVRLAHVIDVTTAQVGCLTRPAVRLFGLWYGGRAIKIRRGKSPRREASSRDAAGARVVVRVDQPAY
ncbi:hypothetical protein, partial [Burkholderia pseudomallei]|uniref:hypothetical protein n=1 Tax=Burkholderia pseudomallei TaxID=28450 RepID=UPI0021F78F39